MPQGQTPFYRLHAAQNTRDAMIQTSNHKLRKRALAEGIDFNSFVKDGIALEESSA